MEALARQQQAGQEQIEKQAASNQSASLRFLHTSCEQAACPSNADGLRRAAFEAGSRGRREDTYQTALLYFTLLSALAAVLCAIVSVVSVVNGRPACAPRDAAEPCYNAACFHARHDDDCDGCIDQLELEDLAGDLRSLGSHLLSAHARQRSARLCARDHSAGQDTVCVTADTVADFATCHIEGLRL